MILKNSCREIHQRTFVVGISESLNWRFVVEGHLVCEIWRRAEDSRCNCASSFVIIFHYHCRRTSSHVESHECDTPMDTRDTFKHWFSHLGWVVARLILDWLLFGWQRIDQATYKNTYGQSSNICARYGECIRLHEDHHSKFKRSSVGRRMRQKKKDSRC